MFALHFRVDEVLGLVRRVDDLASRAVAVLDGRLDVLLDRRRRLESERAVDRLAEPVLLRVEDRLSQRREARVRDLAREVVDRSQSRRIELILALIERLPPSRKLVSGLHPPRSRTETYVLELANEAVELEVLVNREFLVRRVPVRHFAEPQRVRRARGEDDGVRGRRGRTAAGERAGERLRFSVGGREG